jgi:hypothetical protein
VTERDYDMSHLRADGSHYASVALDLPYCLHLPYGHYPVKIDFQGRPMTILIQLESHRRPGAGRGGLLVPPEKAERIADAQGSYRYSSVLTFIPVRSTDHRIHDDKDKMWRRIEARRDSLVEASVRAVNRLIRIYRYNTQECHVRPLSGPGLWFDYNLALVFIDYDLSQPTSKASVVHLPLYYNGDIVPTIPDVPLDVGERIKEQLVSSFEVPIWEELLLNAYDMLHQGNYRLSVIEAETSFEMAIWELVRGYYAGQGRSDQEVDDIIARLPHSFTASINDKRVQVAFAALGKQFCKRGIVYEVWREEVWRLRGDLVHGRVWSASYDKAWDVLETVEDTLQYLLDRSRTLPWRYAGAASRDP